MEFLQVTTSIKNQQFCTIANQNHFKRNKPEKEEFKYIIQIEKEVICYPGI